MEAKYKVAKDIGFNGDKLTNIHTVGTLKPKVSKALGLEDVVMIIAIDSKKQKHLRINLPTRTLAQHREGCPPDLPKLEEGPPGQFWLSKFEEDGDGHRIIRECVHTSDGKWPLHQIEKVEC